MDVDSIGKSSDWLNLSAAELIQGQGIRTHIPCVGVIDGHDSNITNEIADP